MRCWSSSCVVCCVVILLCYHDGVPLSRWFFCCGVLCGCAVHYRFLRCVCVRLCNVWCGVVWWCFGFVWWGIVSLRLISMVRNRRDHMHMYYRECDVMCCCEHNTQIMEDTIRSVLYAITSCCDALCCLCCVVLCGAGDGNNNNNMYGNE